MLVFHPSDAVWRKAAPGTSDMAPSNEPHIAESHLFSRLGKTILFNVDTMLFYEVTPVVADLMTLLAWPTSERQFAMYEA